MKHLILFRGNTIDGWLSAYSCYVLNSTFKGQTELIPVNPKDEKSWPTEEQLSGNWISCQAVTPPQTIIHLFTKSDMVYINDPLHSQQLNNNINSKNMIYIGQGPIALSYYKGQMYSVDFISMILRIEFWNSPSREDLAVREILHDIACLPQKYNATFAAIKQTEEFLENYYSSLESRHSIIEIGLEKLSQKEKIIENIMSKGYIYTLDKTNIKTWNLPESWLGYNVFILNNTAYTIDTSATANHVFNTNQNISIFINYKTSQDVMGLTMYQFYARSRNNSNIDLTSNNLFKGLPNAAGGIYKTVSEDNSEREPPFII